MMKTKKSNVLSVYDLKEILQVSLCEAQRIMEQHYFPVIIIGNSVRVLSQDFYNWLFTSDYILVGVTNG